ncbi:MAG TPA: prepilin-type N-terminal cleavage/methylation domain-containing protein [Patescibacteria group bacterium]|nr:prepilin-type N-terminal cleavage/methylation domain-containing protein [Patescibacteria group bacterium]
MKGHKQKKIIDFFAERKGFTLAETLIYIAIIGVVTISFISFSISISNSRNKNYVAQEVQANIRFSLDKISEKIREAEDVSYPAEGSSSTTLELDMPGAEPNLTFGVSGGVLELTQGVSAPVSLTSDETEVSHLKFFNYSPGGETDNVGIKIRIDYRSDSSDKEFNYFREHQTAVSLRH